MGRSDDFAVPPGADPDRLTWPLHRAHAAWWWWGRADPSVRSLVLESWRRSMDGGLDPEVGLPDVVLDDDVLAQVRAAHPLAAGMPVIRRLLVDSAGEAGLLVAVSDAAGQLLWVEGASSLRSRAEHMHFVEGADWSERSAGTNAPGTALALDRPVQILGPEHLARPVTPWSCSAAPIHDPDTGALLGVLDLTGGPEVATTQSLSLVRATVAAVEAELRIARLGAVGPRLTTSGWSASHGEQHRLEVLGAHGATLHSGPTTTRLSLRHSELLLLIARAPDGLTTAELALGLSEDEQAPVTIRAELSRLRTTLGPLRLASRPYRLEGGVSLDLTAVLDHVAAGRLRQAVADYRGPVLPTSQAPGVADLRDDVHQRLRSALLAADDADALLSFADTPHGRDDLEVWRRVLDVLPVSSPRYAQVVLHAERLDAELG